MENVTFGGLPFAPVRQKGGKKEQTILALVLVLLILAELRKNHSDR